ncbi:MAG TPA: fused MFS/spermidine synthase, partial [Verrucomicrobiae bacterium]|nr:fused MFS/spermidine synthase [Verrucomicrobiae bacterium]
RFPRHAISLFGLAELGVALFGLCSLKIFHWFAWFTSGAGLGPVVFFSLALLLLPTLLMGATLPLLTEQLVRTSGSVGASISRLYFVNTLGSAVACYLCATFLLRAFAQSGATIIAALLNTLVGASAYLYASRQTALENIPVGDSSLDSNASHPALPLPLAMLLGLLTGCIALGYEIAWFRVFAIASSDRAPAFALLLATYLSGIAAGSFLSERLTKNWSTPQILWLIASSLLLSGAISPFLPPLVAAVAGSDIPIFVLLSRVGHSPYLSASPAFFLVAMLLGSIFPLLCRLAISPDDLAGRRVSLLYASNILGSVLGSLGIGFILMQHLGLREIALLLGAASTVIGLILLVFSSRSANRAPRWIFGLALLCMALLPTAASRYRLLYERLIFHHSPESRLPFAQIVENRNGVVTVLPDGSVFGGGVYDGAFLIDPAHDANFIIRALALGAVHPQPRRVLVIGLASGSWAQVLINHPQTESMDIVEINPGYLELIKQHSVVRSLLVNPKAHIYVDDGRRWLLAHPNEKYDLIVTNSTYHWRDHASTLLSADFYRLARQHLQPGGIYYFNSTESDEALATGMSVFPYGLRVINFLAVSDSPIEFNANRWIALLREYRIDGRSLFDPLDPSTQRVLNAYQALAQTLHQPPRFLGLETGESLRSRLGNQRLITDDNMGLEWDSNVKIANQ